MELELDTWSLLVQNTSSLSTFSILLSVGTNMLSNSQYSINGVFSNLLKLTNSFYSFPPHSATVFTS